jgi:NAD(P)-dependent dehydrogenase (short-subunit alcohol dehydrogenase family)
MPALLDYPLEALENVFQVNVFSILALLQELMGEIKTDGRIINVSSDAGVEAYPGWGGYGSSKAALEHLSAILAEENPHWRVYWVDPATCAPKCTRTPSPEKISATGPCRKRPCLDFYLL